MERFWVEESLQEGWSNSAVSSDSSRCFLGMSRGSRCGGWGRLPSACLRQRNTRYQRGWQLNPGHRAGNGVAAGLSGCPFPGLAAPATTGASPRTHHLASWLSCVFPCPLTCKEPAQATRVRDVLIKRGSWPYADGSSPRATQGCSPGLPGANSPPRPPRAAVPALAP